MDRMKTFLKYIIWFVLFFFFSNFIINVGLNSSYKNIERRDSIEQVKTSTSYTGKWKNKRNNKKFR